MSKLFALFFAAALMIGLGSAPTTSYAEEGATEAAEEGTTEAGDEAVEDMAEPGDAANTVDETKENPIKDAEEAD